MSEGTPGLPWENFLRRLRRAQAPHSIWPVLASAGGAQVYVPEPRVALTPPDGERNAIQVVAINLGLERAALRFTVFDRSGEAVAGNLPKTPVWLEPAQRYERKLPLNLKQARALAGGGSLVASPGTLPESHRKLAQVRGLQPELETLEWRFPEVYRQRIELLAGEVGGQENPAIRELWLLAPAYGVEPLKLSLDLGKHRGEPALELLLPMEPVRYRVGANGEWQTLAPQYLERSFELRNPTSLRFAGRLRTSPSEPLGVFRERIDLGPGETTSIRLVLNGAALGADASVPATVQVGFEGYARRQDGSESRADRPDLVRVTLHRQRFEGCAVRAASPLGSEIEALKRSPEKAADWFVQLPIENLGTEPCTLSLDFGRSARSQPAVLPSRSMGGRPPRPVLFSIAEADVAILAREAGGTLAPTAHQVTLSAAETVAWDPLLLKPYGVRFYDSDEIVAEPADLSWLAPTEKERRGRKALLQLMFHHPSRRRLKVKITHILFLVDGNPRLTLNPDRVVVPGRRVFFTVETRRVWNWTRIKYQAKLALTNGVNSEELVATAILRREGGEIRFD